MYLHREPLTYSALYVTRTLLPSLLLPRILLRHRILDSCVLADTLTRSRDYYVRLEANIHRSKDIRSRARIGDTRDGHYRQSIHSKESPQHKHI